VFEIFATLCGDKFVVSGLSSKYLPHYVVTNGFLVQLRFVTLYGDSYILTAEGEKGVTLCGDRFVV
jgi:hypothetical protein